MKKLLFLFIGLAVLASCTKDTTVPENPGNGNDSTTKEATLADSILGKRTAIKSIEYDSTFANDSVSRDTNFFNVEKSYFDLNDSSNFEAVLFRAQIDTLLLHFTSAYTLDTIRRSFSVSDPLDSSSIAFLIHAVTDTSLTVYIDNSEENYDADITWYYFKKSK